MPATPPTVLDVLDALDRLHIVMSYDRGADRLHLSARGADPIPRALSAAARTHRVWLAMIVLGRASGHALAACDRCGELSMVAVREASGGRRRTWPRCRRSSTCAGRHVPRPSDVERARPRRTRKAG
jgi:hypothetical protein